ncbi:hypothetical protein ElyMa_002877300, partial [Elysia marginata]
MSTVFNFTGQVLDYNVTLVKAGDVASLDLPSSGFHHVTGSKPFYLFAKLRAEYSGSPSPDATRMRTPVGVCSVQLLPQILWRSVYTLHLSGPLLTMEVYIVLIVWEEGYIDRAKVSVMDAAQTVYTPTTCQRVLGTKFMGCTVKLPPERLVYSIGDPHKLPLAAYMFARTHGSATCYQLGLRENPSTDSDFDAEVYMESRRKVDTCPETDPLNSTLLTESTVLNTFEVIETPASFLFLNHTLERVEQIKEELKIDVKTTSSFQRKKTTVEDFRTTSVSIGVVSLVLVSMPLLL